MRLADRYCQILIRLHQNKFHEIQNFAKTIDEVLISWITYIKINESYVDAKQDATFLNSLAEETVAFLDLHSTSDCRNVYKKIDQIEEKIKYRLMQR